MIPRPHLLQDSPEDGLARWIHYHTSHHAQERFRDNKGTKSLLDGLSYIGAALVSLNYRNVPARYLALKGITDEFSYGPHPSEVIYVQSLYEQAPKHHSKILVFVHGGAWGSGEPWMYSLCSYNLATCIGCDNAIIIKYPLYPESNLLGQVECIHNAICFISSLYPTATLILSGHSSGANLCALAVVSRSSPVAAMVLFNGVYDINKHYLWEKSRGVHLISPMGAAAAGVFDACSPTVLLANSRNLLYSFPTTLLVHHVDDVTVPFTSSTSFAHELRRKGATPRLYLPQVC